MNARQQFPEFNDQLFEQLAAVCATRAVNMMDRRGVREVAEVMNLGDLSEFLLNSEPLQYLYLLRTFDEWLNQSISFIRIMNTHGHSGKTIADFTDYKESD